jgi:hypothetical protein
MPFRFALFMTVLLLATPVTTLGQTNVLLIVDASGSMKKTVGGESRMDAAKRVLGETLREMPKEARLGLMVYGHRRAKDCKDIELLSPIGADDAGKIATQIAALQPKGETPIAAALEQAARSFAALKGQSNSVVLVTDGIEECNGDPCAAAKAIKGAGLDLKVNIVGFTLNDKERAAIACVAKETGGVYYDAKDAKALTAALGQVRQQIAQAPATALPPPDNLLSAAAGGRVVAAPNAEWVKIVTGKEEDNVYTHDLSNEVTFVFREGRLATFSTFSVLIGSSNARWVKEFELFAADDFAGPYRSLGRFSTQNIRMIQSPYQEFKFAETTAKFLKFKPVSSHGDTPLYVPQLRLVGKLGGEAAAAPVAAPAGQVDLLSPRNGGQLVTAVDADWVKITSGNEADSVYTHNPAPEAVFAFKDGRPATFSRFAVLIASTNARWVKEFEILAADDVAGPYRSLGRFATQNIRLLGDPYQSFAFAETTAKYFKFKPLSTHGDTPIYIPQLRLMGKLDESAPAQPRAATGRVNILASAQGGQLLAGPDAAFAKVISGNEADYVYTHAQNPELIFAFRGEKPATFSAFAVLIAGANARWVKDFELLVADDVSGPYRSLGKFTTQNIRMIQNPYQEFKFPETTAKYLKFRPLSTHGDTPLYVPQLQVIGKAG